MLQTTMSALQLSRIDWNSLSDRAVVVIQRIALPLSWGYSLAEIAGSYGQSERWASELLDELRDELRERGA